MRLHHRSTGRHPSIWSFIVSFHLLQTACLTMIVAAQQPGQHIDSERRRVGMADVRVLSPSSGCFPGRQPAIYWHDGEVDIDLLPHRARDGSFSMAVRFQGGTQRTVQLPEDFAQVDSITRAPKDKAVVVSEVSGAGVKAVGVIDLRAAKLIDSFGLYAPSVSPNGRFIVYVNGFPAHSPLPTEDHYRLYDTMKTPRENTCGFRENDPDHKELDETWRGYPVYPRKADEIFRPVETTPPGQAHELVSEFAWSDDSSMVEFADQQGAILRLIVVQTPVAAQDEPVTLAYKVPNRDKACTEDCAVWRVGSLGWEAAGPISTLQFTDAQGILQNKVFKLSLGEFSPAER